MHWLRSHNTSYCLIEVVTKAGLTTQKSSIDSAVDIRYSVLMGSILEYKYETDTENF